LAIISTTCSSWCRRPRRSGFTCASRLASKRFDDSEDIDLVQIDAAPIGSALDTIRGTLMALTLALVPRGYDKEGVGIEPTEKSHGA
jgi:hypothetical protein